MMWHVLYQTGFIKGNVMDHSCILFQRGAAHYHSHKKIMTMTSSSYDGKGSFESAICLYVKPGQYLPEICDILQSIYLYRDDAVCFRRICTGMQ